jgi:hypothetical protein
MVEMSGGVGSSGRWAACGRQRTGHSACGSSSPAVAHTGGVPQHKTQEPRVGPGDNERGGTRGAWPPTECKNGPDPK